MRKSSETAKITFLSITCNQWLRKFKPFFLVSQPKVHYTEDIKEKEVAL